jgi:hypothetical protein
VSRTILTVGSLLLLLAATGCRWSLFPPEEGRADCPDPAPLLGEKSTVPGYIVVFRDGTACGGSRAANPLIACW